MRFVSYIDNKKTSFLLRKAIRTKNIKQHYIANSIGLNQSQISRLLRGQFQRRSKGLNALCTFLCVRPAFHGAPDDSILTRYPRLVICLSEILDGSKKQEEALIKLIKSARKLNNIPVKNSKLRGLA